MNLTKFAVTTAAVIAGVWVFENFVLGKIVQPAQGFGLDDVALGATIALTIMVAGKVL